MNRPFPTPTGYQSDVIAQGQPGSSWPARALAAWKNRPVREYTLIGWILNRLAGF